MDGKTASSPAGAPVRTPMPSFHPSPPLPEQGQQPRGRFSPAPKPGQTGGPANTPGQGRGKAFGTERGETPPPAGPGARERRGGTEQEQPGYGQPGTPPGG